jgi:hypothetical protein
MTPARVDFPELPTSLLPDGTEAWPRPFLAPAGRPMVHQPPKEDKR